MELPGHIGRPLIIHGDLLSGPGGIGPCGLMSGEGIFFLSLVIAFFSHSVVQLHKVGCSRCVSIFISGNTDIKL